MTEPREVRLYLDDVLENLRYAREFTAGLRSDERQRLVQRAAECGLSLSDYLRGAALSAVPRRRRRQHQRDTRLSQ